ncbi:head-tail connector protein [Rickettsia endosymbiont of Halotydeus destructor]|uniref:head-tail connector protein n=1 Tax=Rickettsia endosymbiont of Halotydeus destructor TaxID=2996754 RepID=UPI003BB1EED3
MFHKNNFQIIKIFPQKIWSLEQVKNYMRIEGNYDDDLILGIIDAAITAAENFTKLNFISKYVKFICNTQGKNNFALKYQPIKEIVKVTKQLKDQIVELTNDQYFFDNDILRLKQKLANDELIVEYVSGFEENNIPHSIKHGIMLHIAEMYDRQGQSSVGLSPEVKNLYLPYRNIQI